MRSQLAAGSLGAWKLMTGRDSSYMLRNALCRGGRTSLGIRRKAVAIATQDAALTRSPACHHRRWGVAAHSRPHGLVRLGVHALDLSSEITEGAGCECEER